MGGRAWRIFCLFCKRFVVTSGWGEKREIYFGVNKVFFFSIDDDDRQYIKINAIHKQN